MERVIEPWGGVAGKRVLITGGTSGIGLAAATELARRGAQLTLIARTESRAAQAGRTIVEGSAKPSSLDLLFGDLASQASIRRLADQALAKYPRIHVRINSASAMYRQRRLIPDGL